MSTLKDNRSIKRNKLRTDDKSNYNHYKTLYLTLKGGASVKVKRKTFSGAGIVLVEKYKNRNNRNKKELVVILFRNSWTGLYEDIGGSIEKKDTNFPLLGTAIREAFEESCGLINITNPKHIKNQKFVDLHSYHSYRSYFIGIKNFRKKDYLYNLRKIKNNVKKFPKYMQEMNNVTRFSICDLINDGILSETKRGKFRTRDIKGKMCTIKFRTKLLLQQAILKGHLSEAIKKPLKFRKHNLSIYGTKLVSYSSM